MKEELQASVVPLDMKTQLIAQQILEEDDLDKIKDLTTLFNVSNQKRNVMRIMKMNELLDTVTDKVMDRFEKNPHNFTNDELLRYMQATENSIERANKNLNMVEDTPAIQLTQNNQVNINVENNLDRESREKVLDAVKAILASGIECMDAEGIINLEEDDNG